MRADLAPSRNASTAILGNIDAFSIATQGELLLESYQGTTDWQEGATLAHAISEIEATVAGQYGEFRPAASGLVADENGKPIAAIYCSIFESEPFIVFTFTNPGHKQKGYATTLIEAAANYFLQQGFKSIHLYVTTSNPAKKLYEKLGFKVI